MRHSNQLRIIAGRWRGRKLGFPNIAGLRPTSDRVRETLFNWLQALVPGSSCLDLFAGSGALGFEAASRGAADVIMVERSALAVGSLRENVARLEADNIIVTREDALTFLQGPPKARDLVFLDPPFESAIIETCCLLLENHGWLATEAFVYLEMDRDAPMPRVPSTWRLYRQGKAGRVAFLLMRRSS